MRNLKSILLPVVLAALLAVNGYGQATPNSTTLSAAVNATTDVINVASASGVTVGDLAFVDKEAMSVLVINGTALTVERGVDGTLASSHTSGETIYIDSPTYFHSGGRPIAGGIRAGLAGSCTSTEELALPFIDTPTGDLYRCTNSELDKEISVGRVLSKLDLDLNLQTTSDTRQVELNSRNFTATTGDAIGFRSAPRQTVAKTDNSVFGGQITAQLSNGIGLAGLSGAIIGLHSDVYLRGTTAATIGADVRALQLELVTDDAGTRTISGDVVGIRMRAAFSATTLTGHMVPFKVEKAEAQTNSQDWDALFKLTGASNTAWTSDTGSGDTESGAIKILWDPDNNGTFDAGYLVVYSDAP